MAMGRTAPLRAKACQRAGKVAARFEGLRTGSGRLWVGSEGLRIVAQVLVLRGDGAVGSRGDLVVAQIEPLPGI